MNGLPEQLILNALFTGLLTTLPVCALNLLYRAYAALRLDAMAVPLLAAYTALTVLELSDPAWPPMLALGAAACASVLVAAMTLAALSRVFRTPARNASPALLIAGLASALALTALVRVGWGAEQRPFPVPFSNEHTFTGEAAFSAATLNVVVIGVVLLGLLDQATSRRVWQADEHWPHKRFALVWAAVLLSAAGIGHALRYESVYPAIRGDWWMALAAVCIGGLGRLRKGALAGFALAAVASIAGASEGPMQAQYIAPLLLALVLALRPKTPDMREQLPAQGTGHALGLVAFIGLLPWIAALAGGAELVLHHLPGNLPFLLIAFSFYAVLRLKLADLGFMMYPALGAYIYACFNSTHLAGMVGEDGLAAAFGMPAWSALPAAAALAAGIALAVYRVAGRRTAPVFAVFTLVLGGTCLMFINNAAGFLDGADGPGAIGDIHPLLARFGTLAHVAATAVLALGILLTEAFGERPAKLRYALAAASAAVAGALMSSMNGYLSPANFGALVWLEIAAIVLLAQRGGSAVVLATAAIYCTLKLLVLPYIPEWPAWQEVTLAAAIWLGVSFSAARDEEQRRSREVEQMLFGRRPIYG